MLVDPEQIWRAQAGDLDAFKTIVRAYRPLVLGTLSRLVRPEQAVELGTQVFLLVHRSLGRLESAQNFEPWLLHLTANAAHAYRRKNVSRTEKD